MVPSCSNMTEHQCTKQGPLRHERVWCGRTWLACTESWTQPDRTPLGWIRVETASQAFSSNISVWPHKCASGRMVKNSHSTIYFQESSGPKCTFFAGPSNKKQVSPSDPKSVAIPTAQSLSTAQYSCEQCQCLGHGVSSITVTHVDLKAQCLNSYPGLGADISHTPFRWLSYSITLHHSSFIVPLLCLLAKW